MKLIISNLNHLKWNFRTTNSLNPIFVSEQNMKKIKSLFGILKNNYTNISKYEDQETYALYFRVPKGKYTDDEEYKNSVEYNELDDARFIKDHWDNNYPNKYKWFSLDFIHSTYRKINYYAFYIDNQRMFMVSDEEYSRFERLHPILIPTISRIISHHIKLNSENKFQKLFIDTFGYEKRLGIISYKDAWKIYPSLKRNYFNKLNGLDLKRIFQEADNDCITYFPKFTSGQYYDICKIGYLGVDKKINKAVDSKALFYKKADGRTFDLENINTNNEEEFDKWFEENGKHPDHAFEIFPGRSFYRGDLWINKNGKGYYLSLSGSNYHTQIDVLKFYDSLLKNGIKVKLIEKELYKTRIDGTAIFAIESEDNWCYGYTTIFGNNYIDSVHISDLPKLIPYVQWEDAKMSKYIGVIKKI